MHRDRWTAPLARHLPEPWRQPYDAGWRLLRIDRPIGWMLLLWPTLIALLLAADGRPPWPLVLVFVAGVWLTRAAGCAFNDYADRWLDGRVERTCSRPLVTGEISGRAALYLFCGLMAAAFLLVLTTNAKTVALSVAALLLAAAYPYMKRHTYLPQVWLGVAFSAGIPMAYSAVRDAWPPNEAWLLFCANVLWTTAYDTWYAMADRADDRKAGAKSTAILLGDLDLLALALLYLLFGLAMILLGLRLGLGSTYWLALALATAIVLHAFARGRSRRPPDCLAAFRANNHVGAVLFAGVLLHYLLY